MEKNFVMNIIVGNVEFEGNTANVYITSKDGIDPLGEFTLPNFVPDDYNVKEIIVGGYETPDYKEIVDEDLTIEEWWEEYDDKEFMIEANLTKQVKKALEQTKQKLNDPNDDSYTDKVKVNVTMLK